MFFLKPLSAALILGFAASASASNTLVGFASLPANTFAEGPTSGQFAGTGAYGNSLPLIDKQPVQGFSAVLNGPTAGTYYVMQDNGFGTQGNSADTILRMFAVRPDFRSGLGGTGSVTPVDFVTGADQSAFTTSSLISLRDPDHKLGFTIQADYTHYYNNAANPLVDASIKSNRYLTGADLDIESVRKDRSGNLWFGDEFGPFLIKTDATGKVLRSEIALSGVMAPQNPYLNGGTPNLGGSGGFEGMALNASGTKLYPLLEKTVTGDPAKSLRISEFDLDSESYTSFQAFYQLDPLGAAIGDMTAIDDHRFLVIERDNGQGASAVFKKIFAVDIADLDAQGYAKKTEVLDLMNIADPDDLNGDGSTSFKFPFVTIEDVLIMDANTLLVINDNNYPGSSGRLAGVSDNNEFILVNLAQPVPEPETYGLMLAGLGLVGLVARRRGAAQEK